MIDFPTFEQFYSAVHGKEGPISPFPWQSRLAALALEDKWPEVISVPTASGKTSVIDVAVYALASQADRPALCRTAAIRTIFVVDRRLVVDDAATHAGVLATYLMNNPDHPVAQRLLKFGGEFPLVVSVLRGGMFRDDAWIEQPNQPVVCLSTVDQIGSRLLFRGYQLSNRQWPVHAGLAACDARIIIDEAHLSTPFIQTVNAIQAQQRQAETQVAPIHKPVRMSATLKSEGEVLELGDDDRSHPVLNRRLSAKKLATLIESSSIEADAAEQASRLHAEGAGVVGVVLNSVASARKVFEILRGRWGSEHSLLLTGRIRPYDRDCLIDKYLSRARAGRRRSGEECLFVVATQTVEVGANLDFDSLVTEAAPIDSLRQRFGRLDRLGSLGTTRSVVLLRKQRGEDLIYGKPLMATWKWLNENATEETPKKKKGKTIDFGIRAMEFLLSGAPNSDELSANEGGSPLLFPAHFRAWAQTSPSPEPDPVIAPFLHGMTALDAAEVQIVWRADLTTPASDTPPGDFPWADIVAAAPPVVLEALPVTLMAARRWLESADGHLISDLEGIESEELPSEAKAVKLRRPYLRWKGPRDSEVSYDPRALRPGDSIVVPAEYGGADEFGWDPGSRKEVRDIGDEANNQLAEQGLRGRRQRLHPKLLRAMGEKILTPEWVQKLTEQIVEFREDSIDQEELLQSIREAGLNIPVSRLTLYGETGVILRSKRTPTKSRIPANGNRDITDLDDSGTFNDTATTLAAHLAGVAKHAQGFANGMGLAPIYAADLEYAARWHDIGKRHPGFQALLRRESVNGSNEVFLAKSERAFEGPSEFERLRRQAGYPKGGRHEFTSVSLYDRSGPHAVQHSDLVRYLIGTHHGYGRPWVPIASEDGPVAISCGDGKHELSGVHGGLEQLSAHWPRLFWSLVKRYGYWGLAYLEAILRRADCVQSGKEQDEQPATVAKGVSA